MTLENVILGAGAAGLGAACASEFQYPVFETETYSGGLCSGFEIQGFRFDRGVHLSFSTSDLVRRVFDQTPYYCYHPYPRNWYYDRWIKHPVQNNLFPLPLEKKICAIESFIERPLREEPANFKDWSISRYGQYISEEFSFLYNRKYWCEDLEKIGVSWVGNRFYQPSLHEVLTGSYTEETENTYYAKEMRYPKEGGYGAFLSKVASKAQIYFGKRAVYIDSRERTIHFEDGTKEKYGKIFSSLPLPELVGMLGKGVPAMVNEAVRRLNYTGVALVSVGLQREKVLDDIWFYIYDRDIMTARVNVPSNKSPQNAPQGCTAMQFEIYFNARETPPTVEECIENTKLALKRLAEYGGFRADPERDVLFMDCRIQKYGNIIMYPDNEKNSGIVKSYLKSIGIVPIGRFGEWGYFWSDQAFLSGYNRVESSKQQGWE